MTALLHHFWRNERGETSTMSLLLIVTILAIGAIVGLTSFRDQVVQELGDIGVAIESVNQSYSASSTVFYNDPTPFPVNDNNDAAPPGLCINVAASPEG